MSVAWGAAPRPPDLPYNPCMMDEQEFRRKSEIAIDALKKSLIAAEDSAQMEVEEQAGAVHVSFDDPAGRFVISPNAPALEKTGEKLKPLVSRLINEQLGREVVALA